MIEKQPRIGSQRTAQVFRFTAMSIFCAAFANSASGENYEWVEGRHACVVESAVVLQHQTSGLKPTLSQWLNAPASFVSEFKSCRTPPSAMDRGWSGCFSEDQILLRILGSEVNSVRWEPSFSNPRRPEFQTFANDIILFETDGRFHFSKPSMTDATDDQGFFSGEFGWFTMSGNCNVLDQ